MRLTTWKIRGLGSKRKQKNLSNRIKEEKPDMVFIQETKCSVEKIREKHNKWLSMSISKSKQLMQQGGFSLYGIHRNLVFLMRRHLGTNSL